MGFYRKKPLVIEAVQFTGKNHIELERWSNRQVYVSPVCEPSEEDSDGTYMQIKTFAGVMAVRKGDYIIKGIKGEFYPCKPDIFEASYESVERG